MSLVDFKWLWTTKGHRTYFGLGTFRVELVTSMTNASRPVDYLDEDIITNLLRNSHGGGIFVSLDEMQQASTD